jgi:hypothetical protein
MTASIAAPVLAAIRAAQCSAKMDCGDPNADHYPLGAWLGRP